MKSPHPHKPKRVRRYKRKISKANIASKEQTADILFSDLSAEEPLNGFLTTEVTGEIINEEENIYPDSPLDFI